METGLGSSGVFADMQVADSYPWLNSEWFGGVYNPNLSSEYFSVYVICVSA